MGRKLREQKPEDRQLEGDPHPSSCSLCLSLLPPPPHRALARYDSYKDRLVANLVHTHELCHSFPHMVQDPALRHPTVKAGLIQREQPARLEEAHSHC